MARMDFEDLEFIEEKNKIKINLYKIFYFFIPKTEFQKLGEFKIGKDYLEFLDITQDKASRKFDFLLMKYIQGLKSSINNLPSYYIHKNSGIPLIGSVYFGLVDRGTTIIEIKPFTGCNFNCIYCSVDEGKNTKKLVNYLVEKDYLVEEFQKLAEYKGVDKIEAHIGGQCEPTLYAKLEGLVEGLREIPQVNVISIDTNGSLLNKKKLDNLILKGLNRINLSINALDKSLASEISGSSNLFDLDLLEYIASKIQLIIAPVWIPGINDKEIPKIIELVSKLKKKYPKTILGIQNFLSYRFGRNPAKAIDYEIFYSRLKEFEKEFKINLTSFSDEEIYFKKTRQLEQPFKIGEVIKAEIILSGRKKFERIARTKGRLITIHDCSLEKGLINIKISKMKNNLFMGKIKK